MRGLPLSSDSPDACVLTPHDEVTMSISRRLPAGLLLSSALAFSAQFAVGTAQAGDLLNLFSAIYPHDGVETEIEFGSDGENEGRILQQGRSNQARIDQDGQALRALIRQEGNGNDATLSLLGEGHQATVRQDGRTNLATADLVGEDSEVSVDQSGNFQSAILYQDGLDNAAHVRQRGSLNNAGIIQLGDGNYAGVEQTGFGNQVGVLQTGDLNHTDIEQFGGGNWLGLVQDGSGNVVSRVTQSGGATVLITQSPFAVIGEGQGTDLIAESITLIER